MSARYGIGRIANSNDFGRMQRKVENLYDDYNYNSKTANFSKCSELIQESSNVQKKLCNSLTDIASENSRPYIETDPYPVVERSRGWPCYSSTVYYPSYSYTTSSSTGACSYSSTSAASAAALAASAALKAELAINDAIRRKNAEIEDLSSKYQNDIRKLERSLSSTKLNNCELNAALSSTKDQLFDEKLRSSSAIAARQAQIDDLNSRLSFAECKLSSLEPKAELAGHLEREIFDLRNEIRRVKAENAILADSNELQAKIIKSRAASPVCVRSRPVSPCLNRPVSPVSHCVTIRSRPASPCAVTVTTTTTTTRSRPVSPVCSFRVNVTSPLSPNHCTQVIRQDGLISRFTDLYTRDRVNAMDILKHYSDDYESNQRIIFSAVQEAFSVAKRTFADWKIRIRSTLAINHCGPETLEEAVQIYINKNIDLYDLPYLSAEVISALKRNPKLCLPIGVCFNVIISFIREACRIAWEMSTLAYPLDVAFALDGEVMDESKYRRSFDSEFTAPLINHHIWPCLMQGLRVISKGEACTRRCTSLIRCRSRNFSPFRCTYRTRSPSPALRRCKSSFSVYYSSN